MEVGEIPNLNQLKGKLSGSLWICLSLLSEKDWRDLSSPISLYSSRIMSLCSACKSRNSWWQLASKTPAIARSPGWQTKTSQDSTLKILWWVLPFTMTSLVGRVRQPCSLVLFPSSVESSSSFPHPCPKSCYVTVNLVIKWKKHVR